MPVINDTLATLHNIPINQLNEVVDYMPASLYWKTKDSVYLGRNQYAADRMHQFGLEQVVNKDVIIGRSDAELLPSHIAEEYRSNDLFVMQENKEIHFEEHIVLPDGNVVKQLSFKKPGYDSQGNIIGLIGITFDYPISSNVKKQDINPGSIFLHKHKITNREAQVLVCIMRGKTAKVIAAQLGVSFRTIETHLANIKLKLRVTTKSQLIELAYDHMLLHQVLPIQHIEE